MVLKGRGGHGFIANAMQNVAFFFCYSVMVLTSHGGHGNTINTLHHVTFFLSYNGFGGSWWARSYSTYHAKCKRFCYSMMVLTGHGGHGNTKKQRTV